METTGRPRGDHRETTVEFPKGARETTERPQRDHRETTGRPQRDHRETTERPQSDYRRERERPQGDHRETTERPPRDHSRITTGKSILVSPPRLQLYNVNIHTGWGGPGCVRTLYGPVGLRWRFKRKGQR